MTPIITSVSPNTLYDTGLLTVTGENLASSITILLINGISANIISATNTAISAEIPRLLESGTYDVRVLTKSSRSVFTQYSEPMFVDIRSISERDYQLRQLPVLNPDESKLLISE